MSRRLGALPGVALLGAALLVVGLLATACTAVGDPGWQRTGSPGCRQSYGARGSTSATRPDVVFFCAESP